MLIFLVHHALTVEIIAGRKHKTNHILLWPQVVSTGNSGKASIFLEASQSFFFLEEGPGLLHVLINHSKLYSIRD